MDNQGKEEQRGGVLGSAPTSREERSAQGNGNPHAAEYWRVEKYTALMLAVENALRRLDEAESAEEVKMAKAADCSELTASPLPYKYGCKS